MQGYCLDTKNDLRLHPASGDAKMVANHQICLHQADLLTLLAKHIRLSAAALVTHEA